MLRNELCKMGLRGQKLLAETRQLTLQWSTSHCHQHSVSVHSLLAWNSSRLLELS